MADTHVRTRSESPPWRNPYRKSQSPERSPRFRDVDAGRARERQRQEKLRSEQPEARPSRQANPAEEYKRLMEMKSGGRYVPPARLRALREQIAAEGSPQQHQRLEWDKLKKNINGAINKVNKSNIKGVTLEVFQCNILRGKGIFVRSIMRAQGLSSSYTPIYASLVAIINSKIPEIGELLIKRLIIQFRRAFKRKDKGVCLSSSTFLAHLCNQQVAHEILCLQILHLLLKDPTDDMVEVAVSFIKEVGAYLADVSSLAFNGVFDRFTSVLHEGKLDRRTQYMIETLFQIRKNGFADNPVIPEELDLVEEDDQNTHLIGLDEEIKGEESLNVFHFDESYEENERKYEELKQEILGDDEEEEDDESISGRSDSEEEEPEKIIEQPVGNDKNPDGTFQIRDMTNNELLNLRKTIYLSIMSTMSVDEICHKLLKLNVPNDNKFEIVKMLIECCSQEKIYNKIYGAVGSKFCRMSMVLPDGKRWENYFEEAFELYYTTIHRYETNKLRNIAVFFGHILATDSLSWSVFQCVKMTEEDSNASSRIFIKILFEEMKQELGLKELVKRFDEDYLQPFLTNMMPMNPQKLDDTRFSINYFTAIDLGVLTEKMREFLDNMKSVTPSDSENSDEESERGRAKEDYSDDEERRNRSRSSSYERNSPADDRPRRRSSVDHERDSFVDRSGLSPPRPFSHPNRGIGKIHQDRLNRFSYEDRFSNDSKDRSTRTNRHGHQSSNHSSDDDATYRNQPIHRRASPPPPRISSESSRPHAADYL